VTVSTAPTLTADEPPSSSAVGVPYSYTFGADGFPQPVWSLTKASTLPAGVTLNATTGTLSGTPTKAGTFNFAVVATNGAGSAAEGTSHTLTVTAEPAFTSAAPPAQAALGKPYSHAFTTTGYPAPHVGVHSGDLPDGLTLDSHTGVLSGTPTSVGTYTFTVGASSKYTEGAVSGPHTITVVAAPTAVTHVVAAGGHGQIDVSWKAPVSGGPVKKYLVSSDPGAATCETAGLSCVLGGTAGETYEVTVTPVGALGLRGPAATVTSTAVLAPPVADAPPADAPTTLTTTDGKLSAVEPGQKVTVIGTGFLPYSTANVVIYSTPQVLASVLTDGLGNFTADVTVPADLAVGQHTLVAAGVDPSGAAYSITMAVTVGADGQPAATPAAGDRKGLAYTGAGLVVPMALTGMVLLVAGTVLIGATRRRRAMGTTTD
jgi:hypothetical protein